MKVCAGTWHKLKSTNRSKCNLKEAEGLHWNKGIL